MTIDKLAPSDQAVQRTLVLALRDSLQRRQPATPVTLMETHISYVLLTGQHAYKIKKAIDLGFLDFSTLALRHRYCAEEVRLNRRLADQLYRGVMAIRGTPGAPIITDDVSPSGTQAPLEYAVKMEEFAQDALFDRLLTRGELQPGHLDALAVRIAAFHAQAKGAPPAADLGSPQQIWRLAAENLAAIAVPDELVSWSRTQYARLAPILAQRRADGFIRECHGDLHLGNIALHDGVPLAFDCIEFSDALRWIDVINEVAFLVMDLEERGRPDLAWRFVNRYLEESGDYAGMACLPFYRVYRALVRAKIAGLRATQETGPPAQHELAARDQYLDFALRAIAPRRRALVLMHGFSGSGKTRAAQTLQEALPAVRLRSDVERKRLAGLPATAHSGSAVNAGLYAPAVSTATYQRLAELARALLAADCSVIIDATCLERRQRRIFIDLAGEQAVPCCIVSCRADDATLRRRLLARAAAANDASEAGLAVLEEQLRRHDPLDAEETARAVVFDGERESPAGLVQRLAAVLTPH